nr:hypothetical protein [Sicyoidochytrium minutum DNA virus]
MMVAPPIKVMAAAKVDSFTAVWLRSTRPVVKKISWVTPIK